MSRLDIYLGEEEISEEAEDMIMDKAMDLIMGLDPDALSEDQAEGVMSIIDLLEAGLTKKQEKNLPDPLKKAIKKKKGVKDDDEEEDDDSMDEIKKVRIDPAARRKRKQEYKKNKAKRKKEAKKYRKSAKGKMMAKKAKRMAKTGKTASGKKKVQYR